MVDQLSLERIELLHPWVRDEARQILEAAQALLGDRVRLRFTHTLRTFQEQDALYAIGREKKGRKVTDARGGYSFHNYGLAVDICLLLDRDGDGNYNEASFDTLLDSDGDKIPDWLEVVKVFESYGWSWGGRWRKKDMPHFEKLPKGVRKVGDLYTRHLNLDFIKGTRYVRV